VAPFQLIDNKKIKISVICTSMADKVAFLATMPPADTPRASTMPGYALAAASMGFDVLIF
jgi:hypothetical protein